MKIGIVGFGNMGQRYGDIIHEAGHEVIPYDTELHNPSIHQGFPYKGEVDGVIITTPPHQHIPYAIKALEAGIPVLCEKPIANTRKEIEAFMPLAKEHQDGLNLMVANRRFFFNERIGKESLTSVHLTYNGSGLGIRDHLLDIVHDIHWMRSRFGDPTYVTASLCRFGYPICSQPSLKLATLAVELAFPQGPTVHYSFTNRAWGRWAFHYQLESMDYEGNFCGTANETLGVGLYQYPILEFLCAIEGRDQLTGKNSLYQGCISSLLTMDIVDKALQHVQHIP